EHEALNAADERGLVIHLGAVPVAAAQLEQPPDPHGQPGLLADLADDRFLERLAPRTRWETPTGPRAPTAGGAAAGPARPGPGRPRSPRRRTARAAARPATLAAARPPARPGPAGQPSEASLRTRAIVTWAASVRPTSARPLSRWCSRSV